MKWENTNNVEVLSRARVAIRESWRDTCHLNRNHPQASELFNPEILPAFHDPFAGGGAIPLEAQRLGLESYASDLNPVAVMINKAMLEIPSQFAGQIPVGPIPEIDKLDKQNSTKDGLEDWSGVKGLAEDVRRYGHWMREEALNRIGHFYSKVKVTEEMITGRSDLQLYQGQELTVIAWLWARTVKSPNPVFSHVEVPLVRSFTLSNKVGKEAWVEPVIKGDSYHFKVRTGKQPKDAITGTVARSGGTCIMSQTAMPFKYIRTEGKAGRIGQKLMALVAEGTRERVYLTPTQEMIKAANSAEPTWIPNYKLPINPRDFKTPNYGMETFGDLFTHRQLLALNTFSDLVQEVREKVIEDAKKSNMADDGLGIEEGGSDATAYGDAVSTYLGIATSRWTDMSNSICTWNNANQNVRALFARQAIPMTWDFAELSPFSKVGPWFSTVESIYGLFHNLPFTPLGKANQIDAQSQFISKNKVISTDPPYYDNIGYADLSDFFYIWMRRSLRRIYPNLFATMAAPKAEELVATPYRFGSKDKAEAFFICGMTHAVRNLAEQAHAAFPVTIYYAFKQSETKEGSTTSTGWVAFLEAVVQSGFFIDGTWPIRTERKDRVVGQNSNALASINCLSLS